MKPVWEHPAVARGIPAQLAALDRALAAGAELVGWKVGVGAPAAMAQAGTDAPLVGHLTSATRIGDGATVSVGDWHQPVLEPELAVHLGTDVAPGAGPDELAAAVAGVGPAIELADVDTPLGELETVVAGNVFHRRVLIGPADPARGAGEVEDLRIRVAGNGATLAATEAPTALTGDPLDLLVHVAAWLGAAGRRLRAGHVVIMGSTVPLVPVAPGDDIELRCDPIGDLMVRIRS